MESGSMGNIMELEHFNGQMEAFTKVNGKIVEKMEKGNLQESMAQYLKENGKTENTMEKENS